MAFPYRIIAAPIAGVSTRVYRDIVRAHGADMAYGEMVSARALGYGNEKTWELLDLEGERAPKVVQISGCEPGFVAEAACWAARLGADYVDLNMGCPVPKVVRNHEGSALMLDPELAAVLVEAAASAKLPVSCKIRSGWDKDEVNAVEFALQLEAAGAAFLAVHARTREQFYSGRADWRLIAAVKTAVSIPVIGNGDLFSAADALAMQEETDCDAVMVGRGMLGNPWLFAEIRAAFSGLPLPPRPTPVEVLAQAEAHLLQQVERSTCWHIDREGDSAENRQLAEKLAVHTLRGHLGWYTKGLQESAQLRARINATETVTQIQQLFTDYLTNMGE